MSFGERKKFQKNSNPFKRGTGRNTFEGKSETNLLKNVFKYVFFPLTIIYLLYRFLKSGNSKQNGTIPQNSSTSPGNAGADTQSVARREVLKNGK